MTDWGLKYRICFPSQQQPLQLVQVVDDVSRTCRLELLATAITVEHTYGVETYGTGTEDVVLAVAIMTICERSVRPLHCMT